MSLYTPPTGYTVIESWKVGSRETHGHAIGPSGEDLGVIIVESPRASEVGLLRGTTAAAVGGGEVGEAELARQQRITISRVEGKVPYQVSKKQLETGEVRRSLLGEYYQVRKTPLSKPSAPLTTPTTKYILPGIDIWKPRPMEPGYLDPRIDEHISHTPSEQFGTRTDLVEPYIFYEPPVSGMVSMPDPIFVPDIPEPTYTPPPIAYGTRTDLAPAFIVPATFPKGLQGPKWYELGTKAEKGIETLLRSQTGVQDPFGRVEAIYTKDLGLLYDKPSGGRAALAGVAAGAGYFGYSYGKGLASVFLHPVEMGKGVAKMTGGVAYESVKALSPWKFSMPSVERYLISPQKVMESFAYDPIGFAGQAAGGAKGFGIVFKGGQVGIRTGKLGTKKLKSYEFLSGKEYPEAALFSKESLRGKAYPTGKSAEAVLDKFLKGKIGKEAVLAPEQPKSIWSIEDYHARFNPTRIVTEQLKLDKVAESIGDVIAEHATETKVRGSKIGYSAKQAARPEDIGIYLSPTGEAMVKFVGVRKNFFEGIFDTPKDVRTVSTRNPFAILKREILYEPTVELFKTKGVKRLPRSILESEGWKKVWEYEHGKIDKGIAHITARSERGFDPVLRELSRATQVSRELEAVPSYGTGLRRMQPTGRLTSYFGKTYLQPRVRVKSHTAKLGKLLPEFKDYKVIHFEEGLPEGMKGILTRYQTEGVPIKKLQNLVFLRGLETVQKTKLSSFEKVQSKLIEQQLREAGIVSQTGDVIRQRQVYKYKALPIPRLFGGAVKTERLGDYSKQVSMEIQSYMKPKGRGRVPVIETEYKTPVPSLKWLSAIYGTRPVRGKRALRVPTIEKLLTPYLPKIPRTPRRPGKPRMPPPPPFIRVPTITRPPRIPGIILPRFSDERKRRRKKGKRKRKKKGLFYSPDLLAKVLGSKAVVDERMAKKLLSMKFTGFEERPGLKRGGIRK